MVRIFLVALGALFLLSGPASAEKMTDKQKCMQGVVDVRTTMKSDETPDPGEKVEAQVEELLEVSTSLCERGNFKDADKLLELARGLVVSE